MDGSGYPDGLKGDEIPLNARIIAVADAYDAMTSQRPYRDPLPNEEAIAFLRSETPHRLDPTIVETLIEIVQPEPAEAPIVWPMDAAAD